MSFSDFKKNRKEKYGDVMDKMDKMNKSGGGFQKDERIWTLQTDKSNNGYAVVRILPQKDKDKLFCALRYEHSYSFNKKYYIENCLSTLGKDNTCPQCEDNGQYWDNDRNYTGPAELKKEIRDRSRKTYFYCNILVIDDPATPDNNGKIFILKFGKQIKQKIDDKLAPKSDRETPIFIYDLWEGCNLIIKAFQKKTSDGEFLSYENSEWISKSPIFEDDKKIEEIYNQLYDIDEFAYKDKFKTEEELTKRMRLVCYGEKVAGSVTEKKKSEEEKTEDKSEPEKEEKTEIPMEDKEEKKENETEKEKETEFPDVKEEDKPEEAENDVEFFKKFKS